MCNFEGPFCKAYENLWIKCVIFLDHFVKFPKLEIKYVNIFLRLVIFQAQ